MTKRIEIAPAPEPLEAYASHFDALLGKSNQREEFRRYLEGLLLPTERHKTLHIERSTLYRYIQSA